MDITDELFHDEYKPVSIPAHFNVTDSWKNKVLYALSILGKGTIQQTGTKLHELDNQASVAELQEKAKEVLTSLFDKGLIKGSKNLHGQLVFNLSKMTETNTGEDTDADQR